MKTTITTIQKKLRLLSALPRQTVVKLGGTTYTLTGNQPDAKFAEPRKSKLEPPARSALTDALTLYGTERNALETLRRHVDTLGDSLDPEVRKRADKLIQELERGHYLSPVYETRNEWVKRKYVRVSTGVLLAHEIGMPFAEIAAAELGRECSGWGYQRKLRVTEDEIVKLSEKFILTIP